MKILPSPPAGGQKTRPAGITVFAGIAVLLALYVASSSAAGSTTFRSAATGTTVSSQSLPIVTPAGTAAGDALLAVVDARVSSAAAISAPSGWALVRSDSAASTAGTLTQAVYVRVAGASDPSSWVWTFSSATNAAGGIAAYEGVDPTSAVDVSSGAVWTSKTKILTAPSVTASTAGDLLLTAYGSVNKPTTASGMNVRWRTAVVGAASTLADSVLSSAGSTDSRLSTDPGGSSGGIAQVIALRPAGSSAPPPPAPTPTQAPANSAPPTVAGTTVEGQTLTASTGTWTGSPTGYAYQWRDCQPGGSACANISGANSPTYTLIGSDVGSAMRVVVTAANVGGSASATSLATTAVAGPAPVAPAAPANTGLPSISGSTMQGQTLTVSTGTWSGSPTSYAYQWRRCDATSACADVSGATAASYLLTTSDVGKAVQAVVTATNAGGSASATSNATATVSALPKPASTLPACTLYVAPSGSSTSLGDSPSSPLTMAAANTRSVPGSVICLAAGAYRSGFVQAHSGTASAWITWRSYNGEPVISWDTSQSKNYMFKVSDGAGYVEFDDITFDGASTATAAVGCQNHGHHIRVLDSTVRYMGDAGISLNNCDYATIVGNTVYRFGDYYGWSSGINLNWNAGAFWYDQAAGFHNVIADNVVSGGVDNSSYHTDGNGIILDLGGDISPTLITGNIVYMNGGRGIETLRTTGKVYVVNNTLYKNGLDLRMSGIGEAVANASSNQVWANNAVFAWAPRYTFQLLGGSTGVTYARDATFGGLGTQNLLSSVLGDPLQMLAANPLFVAPPAVDPAADGQWRNPPTPAAVGRGLALQGGSPLLNAGVDPRTLPGLDSSLLAGIFEYAMTAIDGTPRPAGSGFDYGAYET